MPKWSLLALFLAFTLTSCYATNQSSVRDRAVKQWIGSTENEVKLQLGIPTQETSDGNGGKILAYSYQAHAGQIPGRVTDKGYYTSPIEIQKRDQISFYINADGIIYFARWDSNAESLTEAKMTAFTVTLIGIVSYLMITAINAK